MQATLLALLVTALAEIGDKSQILTLVLAARYRRPLLVLLGVFIATVVSHGLAGSLGAWVITRVPPNPLRWTVGLAFLGMAVWTGFPVLRDKMRERMQKKTRDKTHAHVDAPSNAHPPAASPLSSDDQTPHGPLLAASASRIVTSTALAFFFAEFGDKTQLATLAMAAQQKAPLTTIIGSTLGMMLASAPTVWVGDHLASKVSIGWLRILSAALLLAFGVAALCFS